MNPATPVMTQTFGAETSCSRRRRYDAEITSSQWKGTRRADSGQVCAGAHLPDHTRRASRLSSARGVKASSIPTAVNAVSRTSPESTNCYEPVELRRVRRSPCFVEELPHSCGSRTTTDLNVLMHGVSTIQASIVLHRTFRCLGMDRTKSASAESILSSVIVSSSAICIFFDTKLF
jgi:hypothetical protein